MKEVLSVRSLPTQVVAILQNEGSGFVIADRGEDYQATDVMVGKQLPFRRFVVAGVSARCALVSVEQGGRGHSVERYRLQRIGEPWQVRSKDLLSRYLRRWTIW